MNPLDRAKVQFEAEWDLEDDMDVTHATEERQKRTDERISRDIRRARRDTIMLACESSTVGVVSGDDIDIDFDDEAMGIARAAVFPNGYHEIPLANSAVYRGYVRNGAFNGEGEIIFSNGDKYEGSFQNNLRHGFGTFVSHDQSVKRKVTGTKKLAALSLTIESSAGAPVCDAKQVAHLRRYEGSWSHDRREGGWGIASYSNGDHYEGPFHANDPDTSILFGARSSKFPAEIYDSSSPFHIVPLQEVDDKALLHYTQNEELPEDHKLRVLAANSSNKTQSEHSLVLQTAGKLPTYRYADGRFYVGELKHSNPDGRGALRARNGDITIGQFENGYAHGKVIVIFSTATKSSDGPSKMKKYSGTFRFGKREEGKQTYTDGRMYKGAWDPISEKPHGRGVCKFRSGDFYTGEWFNGKMHGRGRMVYAPDGPNAGKVYDGEWAGDRPHGRGSMLLTSHTLIDCLWEQGKQIPSSEQTDKIREWKLAEERHMSEFETTPLSPPNKPVLSLSALNKNVENWSKPFARKANASVDDLPPLDWFSEKQCSLAKPTAATPSDDIDINIDDINIDSDYDLDDLDITLDDLPRTDTAAASNPEALRLAAAWEYISRIARPTKREDSSDEEHSVFLGKLKTKGFVPELLAKIEDFAESDEEEKESKLRHERAEIEKAKDTSWFTGAESTNDEKQSPPLQTSTCDTSAAQDFLETDRNRNDTVCGAATMIKGWLEKYSIGKSFLGKLGAGSWKTRYFTLILLKGNNSRPKGDGERSGVLLYYTDEACNNHLGTVPLFSGGSKNPRGGPRSSVVFANPTSEHHKKASRPDLDIVLEYEESGNIYKLLLKAPTAKEHDQWILQFSKIAECR